MWTAKYKIWHKNCILRPKCVKYRITDLVYLINHWKEQHYYYYTELHILQGKEENKKKFIKDLKKEKAIIKLEKKGNNFFTVNKEPLEKQYYSPVFDPKIFQTKPIAQRSDGFEDWELACWDKEPLTKVTEVPVFKVKIISIQQSKIADIFLPQLYPKLSPKQKEAVELAVKEGYYEYPKRINLEGLGKISKVRRQTYQENLRRAEQKLIPFLTEKLPKKQ